MAIIRMTSKLISVHRYSMLLQFVAISLSSMADPSHLYTIGPGVEQKTDNTAIYMPALMALKSTPQDFTVCFFVLFEGLRLAESFKFERSCKGCLFVQNLNFRIRLPQGQDYSDRNTALKSFRTFPPFKVCCSNIDTNTRLFS